MMILQKETMPPMMAWRIPPMPEMTEVRQFPMVRKTD